MKTESPLYPSYKNPFLIQTDRPMPEEMAVVGAGHIGPDIAYYLRTGLPQKKLYLVDVVEEPLKKAEKRFKTYARKAIDYKKMSREQADAVLDNIVYTDFPRDILVDTKEGVRIITIRRPQAANALGAGTCDEILAELKKGAGDVSIKGFIISGYGTKAFCAGADIGGFIATLDNREAGVALARGNSKVLHYIDQMSKPVVAAVNGLAMGGGVELAIRCHAMVADKRAFFQLPEITLGILPGMGGAVIPYRKWPHASAIFNEMIGQNKPLSVEQAGQLGMVAQITNNYPELIAAAIDQVNALVGHVPTITEGPVTITEFVVPEKPMAGDLALSKEALSLAAQVVNQAAAADSLEAALEINYQGSGDISCIEASKEGVRAFLQKRKPVFAK